MTVIVWNVAKMTDCRMGNLNIISGRGRGFLFVKICTLVLGPTTSYGYYRVVSLGMKWIENEADCLAQSTVEV